jgi:hypothetical protein
MSSKKHLSTLFLLVMICQAACARQTPPAKPPEPTPAVFRWELVLCEYTGTYDARRYSEAQLRDTLQMLQPGAFDLPSSGTVWKHEDIAGLDVGVLDRQHEEVVGRLGRLDLAQGPVWKKLRDELLAELAGVHRLTRVTWQAYLRPVVLRDYPGADACKAAWAEPLIAGGEVLAEAWRRVNEESRKNNADPDRLRRVFEEQNASPDRLKFAQVEVMAFGWWNCANALLDRQGGPTPELERAFKDLFLRIDSESCDEP